MVGFLGRGPLLFTGTPSKVINQDAAPKGFAGLGRPTRVRAMLESEGHPESPHARKISSPCPPARKMLFPHDCQRLPADCRTTASVENSDCHTFIRRHVCVFKILQTWIAPVAAIAIFYRGSRPAVVGSRLAVVGLWILRPRGRSRSIV